MSSNQRLFEAFDGDTYGESQGFDEISGNFKRTPRGSVRIMTGPPMVAEQLVRTLRTPIGDDPFRPEFGLDRQKLLDRGDSASKEAVIECIGPDQFPWVKRLEPVDIELVEDEGNRIIELDVTVYLADGTPVRFAIGFQELLEQASFEGARSRTIR